MGSGWGILVIVVGLVASIGLHEIGHLIPAKRFGALVPEYAIGFGPTLVKKRIGETTYAFKLLPLGGFVRILGMFAPARAGTRLTNRRGRITLAEEARRTSSEELPEGSEHRAFYRLAWWKKLIVMMGGPAMNLALSFLLISSALVGIGVASPSLTLSAVSETVQTPAGEVASPAAESGIMAGDTIIAVNGAPVAEWSEFPGLVADSAGAPIVIEVERGGVTHSHSLSAVRNTNDSWVIGVAAGVEYAPASWGATWEVFTAMFTGTASAIVRLPVAVWDVGVSLVTGAPRDVNGIMSVVGVGRIAGEATQEASAGGTANWRGTIAFLLSLLASLNMALCVFNLIPLPPLDGGHIVGAAWEGMRRGWARLRSLSDPGPADTARLVPLTWAVGALLLIMSAFLVVADIVRPLTLM